MNQQIFTIIIVEDDPNDYEITLRVLKRRGLAHNVVWLKDGAEALEYCNTIKKECETGNVKNVRIMLLDLKLPKISGFDVLKRVKEEKQLCCIPVIVFSSSNQERDLKMACELHANSYIVKPVEFDHYSRCIDEIISYWLYTHHGVQ
jgi:two-component system response regulator